MALDTLPEGTYNEDGNKRMETNKDFACVATG
jgi:hypothetical protein